MSAFVVSNAHIDYLVSAALAHRLVVTCAPAGGETSAQQLADELARENHASVHHRYRHLPQAERDEVFAAGTPGRTPNMFITTEPVQLLKAIACYEYQSCEHEDWEGSKAQQACEHLRREAIRHLPGYDAAKWEIV